MLSIDGRQRTGLTRREWMRVGGLSLLGLSEMDLARLRARADGALGHVPPSAHRTNSCVFIFLFGGPSHIDLWDMKPQAPREIRGEFRPISTNVPGIEITEHLPLLAGQADKLCLVRSLTHKMNVHGPACSEIYSGRQYFGPPVTDQALPEDWPSLSAMVSRFGRSATGLPASVVLPWYTQFFGQDRRIAGQTGGRMGDQWNPFLIQGDPTRRDFEVQGIRLPSGISLERFAGRRDLQRALDGMAGDPARGAKITRLYGSHYQAAWQLVDTAQSADAFDLAREPEAVRARYGSTRFGQSLLLARRLVESGIPLVTVNWDDSSRSDKVSPHWDTHNHAFRKLKENLCPVFDQGLAAFLADLNERGLLEKTLVVALGEFGRTPKIGLITQNGMTEKTGRDHWPHAFTALLAGGGVRGGQNYGSTNSTGGYVLDKPVAPADLTATILYHLGIDPATTYHDSFQRMSQRLCEGTPIRDLS
jgi:hypothetical protein